MPSGSNMNRLKYQSQDKLKAKNKCHEYRDDWESLSHPEVTLSHPEVPAHALNLRGKRLPD